MLKHDAVCRSLRSRGSDGRQLVGRNLGDVSGVEPPDALKKKGQVLFVF
jgi:hypothetical protein